MGVAPTTNPVGTQGVDAIQGTAGNDTLIGRGGNDVIQGGAGNDKIDGGAGDDALYGGDGADTLYGGVGSDQLFGGEGDDLMNGGGGYDTLAGGIGKDQFLVREIQTYTDTQMANLQGHDVSLTHFNAGGVNTVNQWVRIADLSFSEGDFVRITGYANVFSAAEAATGHSFHIGKDTSSYYIDDQSDVDFLASYLSSHPAAGAYIAPSDTHGALFVLTDSAGHNTAIDLAGISAAPILA